MVEIIFLTPFITGIIAFFLPKTTGRQLLVGTGAIHLILSLLLWKNRPEPIFNNYFAVTPEGLLSLLVISLLFFLISIYTVGYLKESEIQTENIFTGFMLLFLSTMTMVTLSDHIMVMWIAIEATTLASAPLIFTHRSSASLEATWKYVLICSVGIAMALLGSVLITLSMDIGNVDAPLSFSALTQAAQQLDPMWLKAGFVFILVGYGTKMGLAPMHTWLPDAHSEAPSPASALLSGVLLNCAYLGIFKTNKIMHAAGLGDFSGTILIVFGLMSILAERLQMRNMGTAVVYDGNSALAQVQRDEPEVMIIDLKMPGIDGMELLKQVKQTCPRIQVIVMTGHGSEQDKKKCMDLGAFSYMQKPIDINLLSESLKKAYKKNQGR